MRTKPIKAATRRALLRGTLSATAATVAVAYWRKPVVSAVVLPAHAQTSTAPPEIGSGTAELLTAGVENRIPSGSTPEPAIASLSFVGCNPGAVTFTVVANLSPSGTINLGTLNIPNVVPGVVYTLNVSPTIVATVAAVDTLLITTSNASGASTQTIIAASTTSVLTGGSLAASCP